MQPCPSPRSPLRARYFLASLLFLLCAIAGEEVHAQGTATLSLDEAIRRGEQQSEEVQIAEAAVLRARGESYRARSERFPQLHAVLSYDRALASEFRSGPSGPPLDSTAPPPCPTYAPSPTLPLDERVRLLEEAFLCPRSPLAGLDFGNLPFGRENTYRLGLSATQSLFTGGRLRAQGDIARSGEALAAIGLEQARAQVILQVSEAYYDAALGTQLLAIARSSLRQAEETLSLARLAFEAGTQSEFEVLRAQVLVSNQRPLVLQREAASALALLRLKQLLNIAAGEELQLTTPLDATEGEAVLPSPSPEAVRTAIRQARQAVEIRRASLRIARSQRLPSLSLNSNYGRIAYPEGLLPSPGDFRSNWTVGALFQLPLFTGGRLRGDVMVAQADVAEAESRLQQTEDLSLLDTRSLEAEAAAAEAVWQASQGTVEQAERAYEIARLRYQEGVSTQLELTDAQLQLEQAEANLAQSARNRALARIRLRLLPSLPLGSGQPESTPGASTGLSSPATTGGSAVGASPRGASPSGTRSPGGSF